LSIEHMYDDMINWLLSDIVINRADELHASENLRVIEIYDFVTEFMKAWYLKQKKHGVPNSEREYAFRRDPLYLLCSWLNTAFIWTIKTLDVYQRLWGRMQKQEMYTATKEFLVGMSSSHVELFTSLDVMCVQWYTTLWDMWTIDSDVFDEQTSWRRPYDAQKFFLDQQGILQLDEWFYTSELCKSEMWDMLESVTEPRVRCPALFAKTGNWAKSWKVNVVRHMHELVIDRYLEVYMNK
jgi:hypothetical protein